MTSFGRCWLLLVGAALGLLVLALAWIGWPDRDPTPEPDPAPVVDPRLTFPTPYRNVRPEVTYVGDPVCADCHGDIAETYRHHPMGQAMAPTALATPIERYGDEAHNPFVALGLHYAVQRGDDATLHREWDTGPEGKPLIEIEAEVPFVCGSGQRARSYILNRDGYLFQSPITWFPQTARWDLSPGYENHHFHFSRAIAPACLFCHCSQADHVAGTVNRYRPPFIQGFAIGCERCHGPGELHVRRQQKREPYQGNDDTIVNPARLETSLRDAVCEQCHIQGEQRILARGRSDFDFRPGLPLHLFLMDFVDVRNERAEVKFVSSVEQLRVSRCFQESREPRKLGCITCHNPHVQPTPEEKVAHYRKSCLKCHTDDSCALPKKVRLEKQAEDSCIACHMPATGSEVNHTSITDHRIPRRPDPESGKAAPRRPTPGPDDLVPFHRHLLGPDDEEDVSRNLGLALMGILDLAPPDEVKRQFSDRALPLLNRAVQRDPQDWPARETRAVALRWLRQRDEALADFEAVLAEQPDAESPLGGAGFLTLDMNRPEAARGYFERAIAVNPWRWHYHHGLATACFRLGDWDRTVQACQQALRLEPASASTRSLLIQGYLARGQREQARAEFATLWHLTDADLRPDLRRWFDEVQRRLAP